MKDYFKKISIMFTMCLIFVCGGGISVAAEDKSLNEKQVLMHMDESGLADVYGHSVTNVGGIIENSNKKLGKGSVYLNGNSYMSIPMSNDFKFGTSDFTIDAWIYPKDISRVHRICGIGTNSTNSNIFFGYGHADVWGSGARINFGYCNGYNNTDLTSDEISININTWNHIAVTRKNGTIYLFFNGKKLNSFSNNTNFTPNDTNLYIGARENENGSSICEYVNGYMDEFRLINGEALWDDDFTPTGDTQIGAILMINLVDGETKVFDVSSTEVDKFESWYNNKSEFENKLTYAFNKTVNSNISVEEDVVHNQITSFEIRKY